MAPKAPSPLAVYSPVPMATTTPAAAMEAKATGASHDGRKWASTARTGTTRATGPAITMPTRVSATVPRISPGPGGTGWSACVPSYAPSAPPEPRRRPNASPTSTRKSTPAPISPAW